MTQPTTPPKPPAPMNILDGIKESEPIQVGTITLKIPGKNEPGYLRRVLAIAEIQEEADRGGQGYSVAMVRKVIALVSQYVQVSDGSKPEDALLDLSAVQFQEMMNALQAQGSAAPLSPPPSEGK